MPAPRTFHKLEKGMGSQESIYIQDSQMDKVKAVNNDNGVAVLNAMYSATNKAIRGVRAQGKSVIDMSQKYICDIEVTGDTIRFNMLIPVAKKYQIDDPNVPRAYQ